jgi:hypothetical protein
MKDNNNNISLTPWSSPPSEPAQEQHLRRNVERKSLLPSRRRRNNGGWNCPSVHGAGMEEEMQSVIFQQNDSLPHFIPG